MPLPNNMNAFLGAAFLGVISAAGMYLVEHYRQDKVRHAMAKDLARLDQELAKVRRELDQVLLKTNERSSRSKRSRPHKKASSIVSSSTADDYLSSANLDSSDMEFYDLSDTETDSIINLDQKLDAIDIKLDSGNLTEIEDALTRLTDMCIEYPQNPELLWRIGKAHKKITDDSDDKEFIMEHINKGVAACQSALQLKDDSSNIHKWYAILVGERTTYASIQDKINDGFLFKKHVEKALALDPTDSLLHHMMGMFNFEVAGMKWYERKVAAAIFSDPPTSTYPEALCNFLDAEKYAKVDWKSNKLMIAKCKIAQNEYQEAVEWLEKASKCNPSDGLDDKEDTEIKALLQKYNSYR